MPRWLLWMIVVDSVLIPIGVVLLVVGETIPGVAVLVLDVVLMPVGLLFGRDGLTAQVRRNDELSASGVPGRPPVQPETTARIFEE